MCDELTELDAKQLLLKNGQINRRDFSKMSVAAIMMAAFPGIALAKDVTETNVNVTMPEGVSDCYFVHPSTGKYPGVILWPDIKGLRSVYKAIAKRLAASGYSVLVINHYYRDSKAPVVGPDASFGDPEVMKFLRGMASKLSSEAITSDAKAYVSFLDAQGCVDKSRKVGAFGYCMGGADSMRAAAAEPNRIGAIASFHGGQLEISDGPDSTHLLIPQSKAQVLHAIAENDNERFPETKDILRKAYKTAGIPAEIEVYKDTLHGWCTPDFSGYHKQQAEKAWSRLLHLFDIALA